MAWLETEYESLKGKLDALAGKAEYGVQVFWDATIISKKVAQDSPEARKLEEDIRSRPRGIAYMYRQKLESLLRRKVEARAAEEFRDLYCKLSRCTEDIRVEKTKESTEGLQMFMNLCCLVSAERYPDLEAELAMVANAEGHSVRLVGPLPPYSFC